tara:strand:+ start:655 stop:987 length:333 start_codon:yes stop_codon:yes gene_type:complete
MHEPSHTPCPMCGESKEEIMNSNQIEYLADQAINNVKHLNLGFLLCFNMTRLEQKVYYLYQIRHNTFEDIAIILKKKEGSIRQAWNRCKSRGDKALEESQREKVIIPPYI